MVGKLVSRLALALAFSLVAVIVGNGIASTVDHLRPVLCDTFGPGQTDGCLYGHGGYVPKANAFDASKLRKSSNVVDARPVAQPAPPGSWLLDVYNGNGDRTSVPLSCDPDLHRCEFLVGAGPVETPQPTATATAVFLPTVENSPTPAPTTQPTTAPPGALVRINTAPDDVLDTLPHVGPVMLGRIKDARPLTSCADADARVKGWGPTMVADTCPLVDWAQ